MKSVDKLIAIAKAEDGYLEKKSNSQLDSKTGNAGSNNYTKYARDLYPDLQGQAWCDMYVDWCFVQAFGKADAKRLLGGEFSAYTPTSAQYYKDKGQYHKSGPQPGDQIFFRNSQRINHTGIVTGVASGKVRTIEGNTSSGSEVIPNGGAVCQKEYSLNNNRIDGYGRPDWSLVEAPVKKSGWQDEDGGRRYYNGDTGEPVRNDWVEDKAAGMWYWFDGAGLMVRNTWYEYENHWYYLGADGAMVKGQQTIDGKWYIMDQEGRMMTDPVTLAPDQNGALQYPGLVG